MKKKTKNLILSIVVTLILLLTFTVTYAVFSYRETGTNNQQLVLGDIYMHYKESNASINIDNMMPINIDDYTSYKVNPVMQEQTPVVYDNELTRCMFNFFNSEISIVLDDGSTPVTFCRGTGTVNDGVTLQEFWNIYNQEDGFMEEIGNTLISNNIMILENDGYKVNPVMATQDIGNQLLKCTDYVSSVTFDEGTTADSFCKGTGTMDGMTLQETWDANSTNDEFMFEIGNGLLKERIIIPQVNLPYFEFTISGKNTYTKQDIYYEILLNYGSIPESEEELTRIRDEFLKFRLVEIDNNHGEIELFTQRSYPSLVNKKIWVENIPKNTMNEINKTYRLYMWIDNDVVIGNVDQDYTSEEWEKVFASVKVNVKGDFNEKELKYEDIYTVTSESCFETSEAGYIHNFNMNDEELEICNNFFKEYFNQESSNFIEFCQGMGRGQYREDLQSYLDYSNFTTEQIKYLEENNIITKLDGIAITGYDTSCGTDVVVPSNINAQEVVEIRSKDRFTGAFIESGITSVVLPKSVITIGANAFVANQLTSVTFEKNSKLQIIGNYAFFFNYLPHIEIPDNVISIGISAFHSNALEEVTLGKKVKFIGYQAFLSTIGYGTATNDIKLVINKSGNTFDWGDVFTADYVSSSKFAYGTFTYRYGNATKSIAIVAG